MKLKKLVGIAALTCAGAGYSVSVIAAEEAIEEMVVTARGVEEKVRDIPVSVSVWSERNLENLDLKSFEDVAASTPTLDVVRAGSGSGASISIRGIGSTTTSIGIEQSVATILDGVYYPQGRVINEGLFDVHQVAILKGPQALFFGKNATAGVLAIETNDPGDELEINGRVGYEIEQRRTAYEGVVSLPLGDDAGVRLALRSSVARDGFMSNAAGPTTYTTLDAANAFKATPHANPAPKNSFWSGEDTTYARITAKFALAENWNMTIKGFGSRYEINSPTGGTELWKCPTLNGTPHKVVGGVPVPNTEAECRADRTKSENPIPPDIAATNPLLNKFGGQLGEDYKSFGLTWKTEASFSAVDAVAILNFHKQETNWVGDFDGGGSTSIFAPENNKFDNFSGELRGVTHLDGQLNFVGGVYYQSTNRNFDQDVIFAGAENSAAVDPTDRFTAYEKVSATDGETWSAYGEARWDILEDLQATGGVRYIKEKKDSFFEQTYVDPPFAFLFTKGRVDSDQDFDKWVPEFTIRYQVTDDITIYGAYKEGFKSGGFSNSGILGAISGSVEDFTFEPEEVDGWEGGVKGSFLDNTVQVDLVGYTYKFKNLQIDFFNSPTFAFITTNAGGSETKGAELQTSWDTPLDGLTLRAAIAYNKGEYTNFVAPCYAGQRPSQGCTIDLNTPGQVPKQQLAGTDRALAPKWAGSLGLDYDTPLGPYLQAGFTVNYQYKDDYSLNAFGNPADQQRAYSLWDLNARIGDQEGKWQLAVIARNVADKYALLSSGDTPSTGGGTGTEAGFVADRSGTPIPGKSIEGQLTVHF